MKFRLLHISILILLGFSSFKLFSQDGPENFEENISIPGSAIADGINPEDILFADGKYFVAGLGTVLVLNTEFAVINTINLSERGQYCYDAFTIIYNLPQHPLMAFNGINKLFVLSPDNEICVINTTGNGTLETNRILKPNNVPSYEFSRSIIRYDPVNQRVFWVISWDFEHVGKSYLGWYDANSYIKIWDNNNNLFTENNIYDIVINNLSSYFYLARANTIEVGESNINYFHKVKTINSESNHKELLYIHTDELHRVYCCTQNETPDPNIYWIDGDDYNSSGSFQAPAVSMHGMTFIPSPCNELILGGGSNVYIYNGINPQEPTTITLPSGGDDVSNLESFNNTIYVSMQSKIYSISEPNHTIEERLLKWNNYFGRVACGNSGDVVITNMEGASLEIFKHQGPYENKLTGVSVYRSCYNSENSKFYFYSDELRDYSKIAIIKHDDADNSYFLENIISYDYNGSEKNISSCGYNEVANHLLVSSYFSTNQIIKRNGDDNQIAGSLNLVHGFCENIFITPQPISKIFCATAMNSLSDASIEIFNASDYSPVQVLSGFGSGYENSEFRTKFCYNAKDNDVYFILFSRATNSAPIGKLIRIDLDSGYTKTIYDILENPDKIIYCEGCNQIYIKYRDVNYITQFDCNKISNQRTDWAWNSSIIDIEYGKYLNRFYILYEGNKVNNFDSIQIHSCSQPLNERWPIWAVQANCISIKYNDLSHRVYAYSTDAHADDMQNESHITVFDEQYTSDKDDLVLHNSECKRIVNHLIYNDLIVDPKTGYLLTPNGSHSNISVIRCPERFELTNSINWISFPRLERNPQNDEGINSVEALTNKILPGPDNTFTGHMNYLEYDPAYPQTGHMTSIDKTLYTSPWNPTPGGLDEVFSNRGYQLQVTPDQKSIYFYGQIQNPAIPVNLHGTSTDRFCNWVGYYLTYPQSPFDAIPENILNNLRFMAGQYWSCVFYDPGIHNPGPGCWRCAINQGRLEINYGDMVKLTSVSNNSFTWQQNNSNEPSIEKLKADSYTYTEQYNYDAIFIELDTTDLPSEIGAFAGDSCVGATKVLPGDTTVLICAYTEGYEGEDITFEFSYATKAARSDKPDYFVLNPSTGKSERRHIKAGENQSYHFVSFKSNDNNQMNTVSSRLNCYPNPASDAFSVTYFIPEDTFVKLEILNPLGIVVLEKQFGYQTKGNHSCDIQTVGLPIGYYFVRIYSADQFNVGTLLINH